MSVETLEGNPVLLSCFQQFGGVAYPRNWGAGVPRDLSQLSRNPSEETLCLSAPDPQAGGLRGLPGG